MQHLLNRLRKFAELDTSHKALFIQAWFMLGWARAATLGMPFKRLTAKLHHHHEPVALPSLTPSQLRTAKSIGQVVAHAASATPWQSPCLPQVLVVQRLLARRDISGQFYLGVHKEGEESSGTTGLSAHAWLQCDGDIVNGAGGHEHFTVVSSFSWGGHPI